MGVPHGFSRSHFRRKLRSCPWGILREAKEEPSQFKVSDGGFAFTGELNKIHYQEINYLYASDVLNLTQYAQNRDPYRYVAGQAPLSNALAAQDTHFIVRSLRAEILISSASDVPIRLWIDEFSPKNDIIPGKMTDGATATANSVGTLMQAGVSMAMDQAQNGNTLWQLPAFPPSVSFSQVHQFWRHHQRREIVLEPGETHIHRIDIIYDHLLKSFKVTDLTTLNWLKGLGLCVLISWHGMPVSGTTPTAPVLPVTNLNVVQHAIVRYSNIPRSVVTGDYAAGTMGSVTAQLINTDTAAAVNVVNV